MVLPGHAAAVCQMGDLWQNEKSRLTGCTHQKVSPCVRACLMSRRLSASCITQTLPILQYPSPVIHMGGSETLQMVARA